MAPFPQVPQRCLAACILLLVTAAAGAEKLFDFGASFDATQLVTEGTSVAVTEGALAITGSLAAVEGSVRLALEPRWQNLSRFRHVEAEIENTGSTPLRFTFWALSGHGWGGASTFTPEGGPAAGREMLGPGQRGIFRIDLHTRYPGPDAFTPATNPASIRWLELIVGDGRTSPSLRVRSIQATGVGPAELPDVSRRVPVPDVSHDSPGPGRRVYQQLSGWEKTSVTHVLTLPRNWRPGGSYPVIVEYPGNVFYHKFCHSTGRAEQGKLAYGLARGEDFICLNLPFISEDGLREQTNGWGDRQKTVDYCLAALRDVFARYGGDPGAVLLTGFSRGQIAMNYLFLADDVIADVWLAFIGANPGRKWPGGNGWNNSHIGWDERALRMKGRPWFAEPPDFGAGVHVDVEYLEDSRSTVNTRTWLRDVLKDRPGVHDLRGRVTDAMGRGMAGVRVESGPTRVAITDADGRYKLRSVTDGERRVSASKSEVTFLDPTRLISVNGADVDGVDFRSLPVAE